MSWLAGYAFTDEPLPVMCWCQEEIVYVERKYVQAVLTEPCGRRDCIREAVLCSRDNPVAKELLHQQHVLERVKKARVRI